MNLLWRQCIRAKSKYLAALITPLSSQSSSRPDGEPSRACICSCASHADCLREKVASLTMTWTGGLWSWLMMPPHHLQPEARSICMTPIPSTAAIALAGMDSVEAFGIKPHVHLDKGHRRTSCIFSSTYSLCAQMISSFEHSGSAFGDLNLQMKTSSYSLLPKFTLSQLCSNIAAVMLLLRPRLLQVFEW